MFKVFEYKRIIKTFKSISSNVQVKIKIETRLFYIEKVIGIEYWFVLFCDKHGHTKISRLFHFRSINNS